MRLNVSSNKTQNSNITYSLFFKKVELQALMKYYDVDGDGQINYEEFVKMMMSK